MTRSEIPSPPPVQLNEPCPTPPIDYVLISKSDLRAIVAAMWESEDVSEQLCQYAEALLDD